MKDFRRIFLKALRLLPVARYRAAARLGVGAAIEHASMLRSLAGRNIGLLIDVGANVGQFTLVARHILPHAGVIAFEPLPKAARRFRRVHRADRMVELVEAAVGPDPGILPMHVSRAADSSSLLPIGERQQQYFPGTGESHQEHVRVVRLQDAVPSARMTAGTLLKIDVQGFELATLQGCESRLALVDLVYVECSFVQFYDGQALADEVIAWLRQRGFRLSGIGPISFAATGAAIQADLLFENVLAHVTAV